MCGGRSLEGGRREILREKTFPRTGFREFTAKRELL